MMADRIVLHVDFDYFYAQCEEVRRPDLKTAPVAVCAFSDRGGDSGAVATANYAARKFGVRSGMPVSLARRKLSDSPSAAFLPTDFDYYSDMSQKSMDIISKFADVFEYVGRDEAYLDVSASSEASFERASHIAQQLKNAVRDGTGMTCSVGASPNRLLSKIASDYNKPDGLTVVKPEQVDAFLEPLKIRDVPGIGKKAEAIFESMGIRTVGQMRVPDAFEMQRRFGRKAGTYMYNAARGIDEAPVSERAPSVQYSKISTLKRDSCDKEFLLGALDGLCTQLSETVSESGRLFKSVGVMLIYDDMSQKSRSRMLRSPTASGQEMRKAAAHLLDEALEGGQKNLRRLGVKVSELSDPSGQASIDSYF